MHLLRRYLIIVSAVIVASPLFYSLYFYSPYVYTQTLIVRLGGLLLLAPVVVYWILEPGARPRFRGTTAVFFSFVTFVTALNLVLHPYTFALVGSWQRFGSVFDWIILFTLYLTCTTVFRTRAERLHFLRFIVFIACIVGALAIAQFLHIPGIYTQGDRIFSSLGNAIFLGSYLILALAFDAYCYFADRQALRPLYTFLFFFLLTCLGLTNTRGAIVGIAMGLAGLIVVLVFYRIRNRLRARKMLAIASLSLCLLMAALFFLSFYSTKSRNYGYGLGDQTTQSRVAAWRAGVNAFFERPLSGWGENGYRYALEKHYDPILFRGTYQTVFFDKPHNAFIEQAVTSGLIGLLLFCLLLAIPFRNALRQTQGITEADRATTVLYAGYVFFLLLSFYSVADGVLLMVLLACLQQPGPLLPDRAAQQRTMIAVSSVVISIAAAGLLLIPDAYANVLVRKMQFASQATERIALAERAWSLSKRSHEPIIAIESEKISPLLAEIADSATVEWYRTVLSRYLVESLPETRYLIALARLERATSDVYPERLRYAYDLVTAALVISERDPALYELRGTIDLDLAYTDPDMRHEWRVRALEDFVHAYRLTPFSIETRLLFVLGQSSLEDSDARLLSFMRGAYHEFTDTEWDIILQAYRSLYSRRGLEETLDLIEAIPPDQLAHRKQLLANGRIFLEDLVVEQKR